MMEMHQQEMEAMKAYIDKMKSALAQMKANIHLIKDVNEMARWRNNVDMWETLVGRQRNAGVEWKDAKCGQDRTPPFYCGVDEAGRNLAGGCPARQYRASALSKNSCPGNRPTSDSRMLALIRVLRGYSEAK
jgi:hypothetical protein